MGLKKLVSLLAAVAVATVLTAPTAGATHRSHRDSHKPVASVLTTFAAPTCADNTGCGSGSTVGPDGALYVTDGPGGRVLRIDPGTGATTTFVSGLPKQLPAPDVGIGGAMDVAFLHHTAYVLVTLVARKVPCVGDAPDRGWTARPPRVHTPNCVRCSEQR